MPRFGKDKDSRREDLDREAAEEVERLTRRGGPPSGMGGGPGMGGPPQMGIPSPLEMMAERVREQPRPSQRRAEPATRRPAAPAQAFTPLPTGGVGSSFGPAGLSPGPRGGASAPPPSAFGGTGYDDDFGGSVVGPPVHNAGEPDEEEEMSITEMALMDHAARTGHNPEDLVMQYDASSAEEMRDSAMRAFYERQQSHRPGSAGNNPFAPAGLRAGPPSAAPVRRAEDPKAAGGALAQRLAERRRREEEQERRARPEPAPAARSRAAAPSKGAAAPKPDAGAAAAAAAEGALARVLARRRQSLGLDAEPAPDLAAESAPPAPVAPGRRHAQQRAEESPQFRGASLASVPTLEEMVVEAPAKATRASAARGAAAKVPGGRARKPTTAAGAGQGAGAEPAPAVGPLPKKGRAAKAGATATAAAPTRTTSPRKAAPAAKAARAAKIEPVATAGPAAKAGRAAKTSSPSAAATTTSRSTGRTAAAAKAASGARVKVKAVFCIECGEKNPAVAKFCFACGTRLAAPEG